MTRARNLPYVRLRPEDEFHLVVSRFSMKAQKISKVYEDVWAMVSDLSCGLRAGSLVALARKPFGSSGHRQTKLPSNCPKSWLFLKCGTLGDASNCTP